MPDPFLMSAALLGAVVHWITKEDDETDNPETSEQAPSEQTGAQTGTAIQETLQPSTAGGRRGGTYDPDDQQAPPHRASPAQEETANALACVALHLADGRPIPKSVLRDREKHLRRAAVVMKAKDDSRKG
jgi:hypothetical protein